MTQQSAALFYWVRLSFDDGWIPGGSVKCGNQSINYSVTSFLHWLSCTVISTVLFPPAELYRIAQRYFFQLAQVYSITQRLTIPLGVNSEKKMYDLCTSYCCSVVMCHVDHTHLYTRTQRTRALYNYHKKFELRVTRGTAWRPPWAS